MASETEQAVDAYLQQQGITYSATGGHEETRDGWKCDAWTTFFRRPGKQEVSERYYTGIGHRELTKMGKIYLKQESKASYNHRQRLIAENSVAVKPSAASVLYSLLLDAESAEQNFHDWAGDLGYNTDSIKHREIYDACCVILVKLRGFFTGEERKKLRELLEDY